MEFVEYLVGDLALAIHTGKTPPSQKEEYFKDEINWITPSDMDGRKYIPSTKRKVSQSAIDDKHIFLHPKGSIVIGTKGDIGKVCIIESPSASNDQTTGITLNTEIILPELFYYWVKLNKKYLEFKANKAVISILSNKHLRRIKVKFPKKIVDQSKIISLLNGLQEAIDERITSIDLVDQIIKSYFFESFGDPILDNFNYGKILLSDLGNFQSGRTPPKSDDKYYSTDGLDWFTSGELNNIYIANSIRKITSLSIEKNKAPIVKKDSLLIGMYDTAALKLSINTKDCSCNQAIAYSYLNPEKCKNLFVYYSLFYSRQYYLSKRKGARQKNLSLDLIKNFEILDVNLITQEKFSRNVEYALEFKTTLLNHLELLKEIFNEHLNLAFTSTIEESSVFEDLVNTFSLEQIKENNRTSILIDWIDNNKFLNVDNYNVAFKHLLSLLEEGIVEQKNIKGKMKLIVSE